jgi:hypothetical protein
MAGLGKWGQLEGLGATSPGLRTAIAQGWLPLLSPWRDFRTPKPQRHHGAQNEVVWQHTGTMGAGTRSGHADPAPFSRTVFRGQHGCQAD